MLNHAPSCTKADIKIITKRLSKIIKFGDCVLLEGSLGVGKTEFAKGLMSAFGVRRFACGSPTFPIINEYNYLNKKIAHIDFYRLKNYDEIEDIGIPSYFWDENVIVISEWLNLFPKFERQVMKKANSSIWKVKLEFDKTSPATKRKVSIFTGYH
ncbi:MAG: tRNA (adenosine(37)-N6)-threonylcarbamoyltransferase complex ATPase subunit type 1 TsaE [Deltaproteobacteria bacterium]|nr:tRNA (adenosine(37)-N6)-threonylcarbamoyltransferase complex ATPase subunit type 1 TsaE [Deltaproteobacteria bacterium]